MVEETRPALESIPVASSHEEVVRPVPRSTLAQVWKSETEGVHFRVWLATRIATLLPHFAFCRFRTLCYRLCGVRIGARSLILGPMELAGPGPIERRFRIGEDTQITAPLYADAC